jgi:hypothetical protein
VTVYEYIGLEHVAGEREPRLRALLDQLPIQWLSGREANDLLLGLTKGVP